MKDSQGFNNKILGAISKACSKKKCELDFIKIKRHSAKYSLKIDNPKIEKSTGKSYLMKGMYTKYIKSS